MKSIDGLKRKIAHLIIRKKYCKPNVELIAFKSILQKAKEILVIMPADELDFSNSLDVLRFLQVHKKEISVFASEAKHSLIPINQGYKFVSFLPTQINRFFLPDKMLLNRMKNKNYDMVIDLNRKEDTFSSCIANVVNSKIRIGFRKNQSDDYYNLIFDSAQIEPSAAYKKLLEHLNMF